MSKRTFEMYQYRQILVRLRQGDTDRQIARSRLMGRRKLAGVRALAAAQGWLAPEAPPLPTDAELAAVLAAPAGEGPVSLAPWREQIRQWQAAGIQGTTMHAALVREHGYTGSYSTRYRLLRQLAAERGIEVPLRLEFAPADAAQVDFGAGPVITDVYTGEVFKSWFFVMTLCFSRHQYVELVRDQTVATWLGCHRRGNLRDRPRFLVRSTRLPSLREPARGARGLGHTRGAARRALHLHGHRLPAAAVERGGQQPGVLDGQYPGRLRSDHPGDLRQRGGKQHRPQ